jgi:effector-binding domain-containing protein
MEVQTKQLPTRLVASMSRQVSAQEVGAFIRHALDTLESSAAEAGVATIAAPMAIYHEQFTDEQRGLVEVCWAVASKFAASEEVEFKEQAGTEVAYIVVTLGQSTEIGVYYNAVFSWIGQQRRTVIGSPRENYLAKRGTIGDNDAYIEIDVPIR